MLMQIINIGYTANSYYPTQDFKVNVMGEKFKLDVPKFKLAKNNAKSIIELKENNRLAELKRIAKEAEEKKAKDEAVRLKKLEEEKQAEIQKNKKKLEESKSNPTVNPSPNSNITGTKTDWMSAAGIPKDDWQYVDFIVSRESGWNPNAVNRSSGACGLAQALPCAKTGCASASDPVCALKWQYNYVKARYGGYAGAYNFWSARHWY